MRRYPLRGAGGPSKGRPDPGSEWFLFSTDPDSKWSHFSTDPDLFVHTDQMRPFAAASFRPRTRPRPRTQMPDTLAWLRGRAALLPRLAACTLALGWTACSTETDERAPEPEEVDPLRVIVRPDPIAFLPRDAFPVALDRQIAEGLSEYLRRPLVLLPVETYPEMVDMLLAGEADIIASSLTATEPRKEQVQFSMPYLHVDELLIMPDSLAGSFRSVVDLDSTVVHVRPSSSYHHTLLELQKTYSHVAIGDVPEDMDSEAVVEEVAAGRYPATLLDSHYWNAIARFHEHLAPAFTVAENRPIALALHPDADELRTSVNEYLIFRALTGEREHLYTDDFPSLKKKKRLRMLTRNNVTTYFLHRGTQLGYEYELIKKFADEHDMLLEIVVAPTHADLIPWLEQGKGDLIAAAMTITPERSRRVNFTRPYLDVEEMIVTRAADSTLHSIGDLAGRRIAVRESSAFWETLTSMADSLPAGVEFEIVPEDIETERILAGVEDGTYDVTVADSHLLDIEITYGRKLRGAVRLKSSSLGWAVRSNNPALQAALDGYLRREHRGLFANMMFRRYFVDRKFVEKAHGDFRSDVSGIISPFDDLARMHAEQFELDWRLLVSVMYQESRFDPKKRSWAGARGLMQIMPATARELGVADPHHPEQSIEGGARYLRRLLERFDPKLPLATRIRFALASYNAGIGHVQDARRLARRKGWNPDVWTGNVERALLLLQKPAYYEKARFGYCRGSETVKYVRSVERRYQRFVHHVPEIGPAPSPGTGPEDRPGEIPELVPSHEARDRTEG